MKTNETNAFKKTTAKKIHSFFSQGFQDQKYMDWERNYKWKAHLAWEEQLNEQEFKKLLNGPLQTVFGFIANPKKHIFLKPRVTQAAAQVCDFDFDHSSPTNWQTYQSLIDFVKQIRKDMKELRPKDYIDLQSFIWVLGSSEYQL